MKLEDALDLLRDMRISGLVTMIGGLETVLDADSLLRGTALAGTAIGLVTPRHATVRFQDWQPDLSIKADVARAESYLDAGGAFFGFGGAVTTGGEIARVITRYETIAMGLTIQMAYCVCTGPDRHVCAPGDALLLGQCNECLNRLDCR
ncbi:hypothetical protein [Polymorphobacter fuscus]|uniref:Uncharacterized protein n=1 Tax=Sandarakinorhabdus fusca TaxID=1439888 RepID=A0A7C9KY89_9SPHN|nr:hypothetical protein [Polymorphobacter fuscus]KAB7643922.1 hypothetical protein F9290_15335 [Polymorphobacter fuscus]MQT18625.1 hypothetical protein [Polymorphobacter fuscus]NJC07007.1 hypothetical protein [Polymorphobacter fuscus]